MSRTQCSCVFAAVVLACSVAGDLLRNGGFEAGLDHWIPCHGFTCEVVAAEDPARFGSHSVRTVGRTKVFHGPGQYIQTKPGGYYRAEGWVKLLSDKPGKLGQTFRLEVTFDFSNGTNSYYAAALWEFLSTADGWIQLKGDFHVPAGAAGATKVYFQGPDPGIDFEVDLVSVTEVTSNPDWRNESDAEIDRLRKSNIDVRVTVAHGIDASEVEIQVLQTKKSFPFGTKVGSKVYVDPAAQKYRHFLHTHFNWAVPGLLLKWRQLEKHEGVLEYDKPVATIHGLRNHGIKVRGHNMVWSVEQFIPDWVKRKSGDELRNTVRRHIQQLCNITKGLLEHWDVNNENLHGQWFQERLQDRDYDLELFRMAHRECPDAKLFLNDYSVTARGASTRERLDLLAQAGVPIWVTEMTCSSHDEDKRADCYETAFRVYYSHPAVEGILMWGVWDQDHNMGLAASLVQGDNLQLTEAGRRVLDLLENHWMTDETHVLSQAGKQFTVRGFHGNYEIHVRYQGHELSNLKQTFTLGQADKTININIHT